MVLFSEFLLITFVGKKSFPGDNLTDEVAIVAAPFATGEFDSTVFVNTVYAAIIAYPCTFAGLKASYLLW